ncbi:MAG: response regulator [Spirochaetales bacterium]|nr:response regulator [Spirochaetales bacterium]
MKTDKTLEGFTILIVDHSIAARGLFSRYIVRAGGKAIAVLDGNEGLKLLGEEHIDLLVTDIDVPGINGFELIARLKESNINIPHIIMTTADIDSYINLAIEKDIGNIITKEINEVEFIRTCRNLITGENIFGLKHYIPEAKKLVTEHINNTVQIKSIIQKIVDYALKHGMPGENKTYLAIILDEIISNSVYHAHGHTQAKLEHRAVELQANEIVEVCYGYNNYHLGISVTDFRGTLTKKKILMSFKNVIDQKKLIESSKDLLEIDIVDTIPTSGRGLQMIRLMSNDYYFNIKPDVMTQVIVMVNISKKAITYHNSSIKINELW